MQVLDSGRGIWSTKAKRSSEHDLNDVRRDKPAGTIRNRRDKMPSEKSKSRTENDVTQIPAGSILKRQDRMLRDTKSRANTTNYSLLSSTGFISTFILLVATILIYDLVLNFLDVVDVQALKTELADNVHNQSDALSAIFDSLDEIEKHGPIVSVVNFIGGTGVGKTFTANIMKRHFYLSLHETRGPLKPDTGQDILSAIHYKYNLVIIDDLTVDDVDDLLMFVRELPQDVVVLAVCIFNIQETDESFNHKIKYDHIETIERKFRTAGISHGVAKFHEFGREEARAWVVKQLAMRKIDAELHAKIIDSVLDNQNFKHHGLKGLSSKLKLDL